MAPEVDPEMASEMPAESALEPADHQVPAAGRSPETVDRILVGACGAIWLMLLAVSVVATVAMVRLASGNPSGGEGQSSWLLYGIIVVSALIIVAAIPLLLRARRHAVPEPAESAAEVRAALPVDAPTEKMRVFGVDPYAPREADVAPPASAVPAGVLDRIFLRGSVSMLAAMGVALTAVALATYLLAVARDTGAWVALAVAGVITIGMPALLVLHQRMVGDVVEEPGE